eukprot:gnl/TRDRNA2_/TRDRNA2_177464_c5_seq14.p1 gnl/TRDRNA2_/TRDRNA2_177464_c5~~gnl/TRDRNA2_/TRDRNA2_177464_c5_seq14.p1  ORF type:complete len:109 (+),score=7.68 gnl/TRDRNA2_/TRDRNA2_177464_c5_seq14:483-809(+)
MLLGVVKNMQSPDTDVYRTEVKPASRLSACSGEGLMQDVPLCCKLEVSESVGQRKDNELSECEKLRLISHNSGSPNMTGGPRHGWLLNASIPSLSRTMYMTANWLVLA